MSAATLLKNLGYHHDVEYFKTEPPFVVDGLVIQPQTSPRCFTIRHGDKTWFLDTQVVLLQADLEALCSIVARMAPPGSTARLQADGHRAGTVFVGLVLVYENERIPVNLVSGDIGCGITVIPCVDKQTRVHLECVPNVEYHSFVLACMRRSLKRGRVAEQGLTATKYLQEASAFYGDDELTEWLDEMKYVLDTIGIDYQGDVLAYIGKFAQSLGSSGNHFMELSEDSHNKYWLVVHSGSRALGSLVYNAIAGACRATHGGYEIATGALAAFYSRAYDALNKFAKMNRVVCAVAVLDDLGMESSAKVLRQCMAESLVFAPAIARSSGHDGALLGLLGGLTHNGLKAFVNDAERKVMYVLSKGAIAIDRFASAGIVALRAGEGCVLFTLVDESCPWREVLLVEAAKKDYEPVMDAGEWVVFAGHGAGRAQSTSATARESNFGDIVDFFERNDMVGNIAPGVLGDNPARAYKPSSEILPGLPLAISCTSTMLKTRVSHKEGLAYSKPVVCACAQYVAENYERHEYFPLWCDFNLLQGQIPKEVFEDGCARRDNLLAALSEKYTRKNFLQ